MNSIIQFKPDRFVHLFRKELFSGHKRTLITASAVFGILLVIILVWAEDRDSDIYEFHEIYFPLILLAGGFIFTSIIFKDLDDSNKALLYLTLPASNFEKFLSKWLLCVICFPIIALTGYWLFSLIAAGLSQSLFDFGTPSFNPFGAEEWFFVKLYVVLQSIFFIGAIVFRKYVAVKTIGSLFIIEIIFAALIFLLFRILFASEFQGLFNIQDGGALGEPSQGFIDFMKGPAWTTAQYLFWLVMPLLFWTVTFFKLKEKEL